MLKLYVVKRWRYISCTDWIFVLEAKWRREMSGKFNITLNLIKMKLYLQKVQKTISQATFSRSTLPSLSPANKSLQ